MCICTASAKAAEGGGLVAGSTYALSVKKERICGVRVESRQQRRTASRRYGIVVFVFTPRGLGGDARSARMQMTMFLGIRGLGGDHFVRSLRSSFIHDLCLLLSPILFAPSEL